MELDPRKIFKTLNLNNIWIPVVIGLGAVSYLLISDPDWDTRQLSLISQADWSYLGFAFLTIIVRNWSCMYRLRLLTHNQISWLACFYIIVLWEFSSAVTPSVVGGGVVAVFLFAREGIRLGKAIAYVMITAIVDNLFFIIIVLAGFRSLYREFSNATTAFFPQLRWAFGVSYTLIVIYTCFMILALFTRPRFFKWLLLRCTSIPFLRKWRHAAQRYGDDIMVASQAIQKERWTYWFKLGLSTLLIWIARYSILNGLIAAYGPLDLIEHSLILIRHIMLWIVMLISPTPGSSGTAEFFFKQLYGPMLGEYTLITAIIWRVLTYYLYLFCGAIFLPRWLKRIFTKHTAAFK